MKRPVLIGIIALQVLLMGSAFVGGRMLASQNQRGARPGFSNQLATQLPREPAAGSGAVQQIQGNIITLTRARGGGQGASSASNQTDVAVTAETKYYKNVSSSSPGALGGGQPQIQLQEASLTDVKIGNQVMVWGAKNGERITAEVIYIQSSGR
ncbi:MAG: hypothetical protein AB1817_08910 [Chloroflexota bacterium]